MCSVAAEFIELYAQLAEVYNLSTYLDPPAALRQKADEFQGFSDALGSPAAASRFRKTAATLRDLAAVLEAAHA